MALRTLPGGGSPSMPRGMSGRQARPALPFLCAPAQERLRSSGVGSLDGVALLPHRWDQRHLSLPRRSFPATCQRGAAGS